MHIVIVHCQFILYWQARLRALAKTLHAQGDKLSVIETTNQVRGYEFASDGASSTVGAAHYRCHDGSSTSQSSRQVATRLWDLLEKLQPDAVLAAPVAFPEGCAAIRWCRARRRIVVIMDDVRAEDVPRSWLVNVIKRMIYRNVDAMLIPALSHTSSFVAWGVPKERIFFGLDVVDNDWFAQKADAIRTKGDIARLAHNLPEAYFLGIGRQVPKKNWATLITAYQKYRQWVSGDPWGLVLVGEGPDRRKLEDQVASSNINEVSFRAFQGPEEMCIYYAVGGSLILPSYYGETWGLVVNEAMACGLPILVSNQCGCSESLVREGQNGWTFSPDNPEELTEKMLRMTKISEEELTRMGYASRSIISEWPLQRFAKGALAAIDFCKRRDNKERRSKAGELVLRMWKGRR